MTDASRDRKPKVSVVIRALNEGRYLGRLLEGLAAQTVLVDELILVDSGSTDDTVAIAEAAGATVVHINREEFSFGRSLNRGCEAATGDILLIVSAHVYPVYDTFVEHMVAPFDREGTGIAYGRQVGDHRTKFSEARIMQQWFPAENIWDQRHPFSNNANVAVRWNVWAEYKYDESLTGLEDLEFAQRALKDGQRISYVADAPVVHVHEETWSVIRNRYRREAIAYARIVEGSGIGYWEAMRLALVNIGGDYREAIGAKRFWSNALGIPRFRFAQFVGAWEGFKFRGSPSDALLQRFYYPPEHPSGPAAVPGRTIDYLEEIGDKP